MPQHRSTHFCLMTLHRDSSFSSVRLHCVSYRAKYNRCSVLLEDIEYSQILLERSNNFVARGTNRMTIGGPCHAWAHRHILGGRPSLPGHTVGKSAAGSPGGALSTMAQTGVSRLVVVDGESNLDRLFALGGQDRGARQRRPQVRSRRWTKYRLAASRLRRSRGPTHRPARRPQTVQRDVGM